MGQLLRKADLIRRWECTKDMLDAILLSDGFPSPNVHVGPKRDIPVWHQDKIRDWEIAGADRKIGNRSKQEQKEAARKQMMKILS